LVIATVVTLTVSSRAPDDGSDGMPFGRVDDADIHRLQEFALKRHFDLKAAIAQIYGDKKTDEDALARLFMFSREFAELDRNARTYGQIVYASFFRLGEVLGVPYCVKMIDRQPPDVQQRVRDFLYYPDWRARRDENRKVYESVYPGLYPKDYEFGRDDPIFAKEM
jgi:hypothetical protein